MSASSSAVAAPVEPTAADADRARALLEYYAQANVTDGLPVVPVTEAAVAEFLAQTSRDPDDVLLAMPHLNRECTVQLAAVNAVMAGCLPEYFPVVLAAWDSLQDLGMGRNALWQSTTGTAALLLVNGPLAQRLEINGKGSVFGSGFRANATIGRAIRLTTLNAFGLRPHELDQATQASPAKYTCCIAENEDESPWPSFAADHGFDATESTVTAMLVRGTLYLEARHTSVPEQLLHDFIDSLARTGRMIVGSSTACLVLGPEHAQMFDSAGWRKADIAQFLYENAVRTPAELDRVGKGAQSRHTRWWVPIDHPDAVLPDGDREPLHMLASPETVGVVVAGASNAGVSTIVETFGMRRERPAITRIEEYTAR